MVPRQKLEVSSGSRSVMMREGTPCFKNRACRRVDDLWRTDRPRRGKKDCPLTQLLNYNEDGVVAALRGQQAGEKVSCYYTPASGRYGVEQTSTQLLGALFV